MSQGKSGYLGWVEVNNECELRTQAKVTFLGPKAN